MKNYLQHHGILGQRWGVRRYQNKDGTLTEEGKRHQKKLQYDLESGKVSRKQLENELRSSGRVELRKTFNKNVQEISNSEAARRFQEANSISAALDNEAMTTNASLASLPFGGASYGAIPFGRGAALVAQRERELEDFAQKYLNDHIDELASAMLTDLGYEDTEAGRKYLKSLDILNWDVLN